MPLRDRIQSNLKFLTGKPECGHAYRPVIEISSICNLKCSMCRRNSMKRKTGFMEPELFQKILEENHTSLEFVSLNGFGEPLLHPDFFRLIRMCRAYHIPSGISTNCTKLTREMSERLIAEGPDQITLAIDSVDKETYETIRVGGSFEQVCKNVIGFLECLQKSSRRPFVVLQSIYMTENKHRVKEFFKAFSNYPHNGIRIRQLTHTGNVRTDADYHNSFGACYWLWNEPMILSNGSVVPCCQDAEGTLSLGNLKEASLHKLWTGETVMKYRRMHSTGKRGMIPLCRTCNMFQPSLIQIAGSTAISTPLLNKWLPLVETAISFLRYGIVL